MRNMGCGLGGVVIVFGFLNEKHFIMFDLARIRYIVVISLVRKVGASFQDVSPSFLV